MKVFLDPLDKEKVESKLEAMAQIYSKLTTHKISIGFSRPNSFQTKVLATKNKWAILIEVDLNPWSSLTPEALNLHECLGRSEINSL